MKTSIASWEQTSNRGRLANLRLPRTLAARAIIIAAAMAASPGIAADFHWSGQSASSDTIDQNDNWSDGSHPSSGDNLYFNNTTGARHWPDNNSGSWFNNIITYNGAGGIKWCGATTLASKFENSSDPNLFEIAADIGNRSAQDIEINPIGAGGIKVDGAVTLTGGKQLRMYCTNSLVLIGAVSGDGGLTKYGNGALTLSGANTYGGGTKVYVGTLKLGADNTLPIGTEVTLGYTGNSTTLDLAGHNQQVGGLYHGGTAANQTIGNSSTSADSVLTFNTSGSFTFGGIIKDSVGGGTRSVALIISGGTLALTARNSYSGGTSVSGGTLMVDAGDDRLPVGTTATLGSGSSSGLLQLGSTAARKQTIAGLAVSGTGTANAVVGGYASTSTLTISNAAEVVYTGKLGGTGVNQNALALVKAGTGVLTLTGVNTYSGATSINTGKLIGQTGGSCASSGFTVSSGATNGVKLAAPGGQWSCANLTYNSGTTYADFDFGGFAPSPTVAPLSTGPMLANASVKVMLRNLASPAAAGNHPLIHYSGTDPSLGNFSLFSLPPNIKGQLALDTVGKNVCLQIGLAAPDLAFPLAPGISKRITLSEIQASGGLSSAQPSPAYAITGVSANSAQGGTVVFDAATILYTYPTSGSPVTDSFTYTITDGAASVTATVTLTFQNQTGPASATITVFDGIASVTLYGIPGLRYDVQRSTDGLSTWTTLVTAPPLNAYPNYAGSNGAVSFTDDFSDLAVKPSSAYYRTVRH